MEKLLTDLELKELNKFGKLELTASHVYQELANKMQMLGHFGAQKLFTEESDGERTHYRKIADFANNLNCQLSVESLEKPSCDCQNIKDALLMAFGMEKDLMLEYEKSAMRPDLSLKVVLLLQEFTTHQVGAVGEYADLLARLALTDNMLLFDQELGK